MSGTDEAVAAWAHYFEGNPDAARAAHAKLDSGGQLGQTEQLGLSVALTPAAFRRQHYGDNRVCPYCAGDRVRARREERRQAREGRAETEELEGRLQTASEALDRQAAALNQAYRYIRALENDLKKERGRRRWIRER
jgi:hypothetical protein